MHVIFYALAGGTVVSGIIQMIQRQAYWGSCALMLGVVAFLFALLGYTPVNGPAVEGPRDQIVFETGMMFFASFLAFGITWPTRTPKEAPCFG
jgi:hypothetical protein